MIEQIASGQFCRSFMRGMSWPRAVRQARLDDRRALEDRWLDEAYELERGGNPARAGYVLGWAERLAAGQLRGSK